MPRAGKAKGRKDINQAEIEAGLTRIGIPWFDTSDLGDGWPDLATGYKGETILFEVKRDDLPPSRTRLTPAEKDFWDYWQGRIYLVHTLDEVLYCLGVVYLSAEENRSRSNGE